MPAAPPDRRPPFRLPAWLIWTIFGALGLTAVGLIDHLYRTAQNALTAANHRAVEQETTAFLARADHFTSAARLSALTELIGFHDDGLGATLRQWDEANLTVVRTFVWRPDDAPDPAVPAALWTADADTRRYVTRTFAPLDDPALPAGSLGYQAENLDVVRYAGRVADPVAGWAADRRDPAAPWIIWYRTGPAEPVRGACIDPLPLLEQLRALLPDPAVVEGEVTALAPSAVPTAAQRPLTDLPAYAVALRPGPLLRGKQQSTRLAGATTALLLGCLLVGGILLVRSSQRAAREARRKTTFVALVSHELRTPVTSIRLFADLLAQADLPAAKRARFVDTIQRESRRLGTLIERLLTFQRLEQASPPPPTAPVDLPALLRDVIDTAAPQLAAAGLTPHLALPPQAPGRTVLADTDADTVRQALLNLLDNAAKYAPASGRLVVSLTTDAHGGRIRVADRGPGVPSAQRERIFDAFVQGHEHLHEKRAGLGLGLAIARTSLRAIGGNLVLEPSAAGAAFTIVLPLATPAQPPAPPSALIPSS